jgi:hypothetical protein
MTKRDTFRLLLVLGPPPEIGRFCHQTRSLGLMMGYPLLPAVPVARVEFAPLHFFTKLYAVF